MNRIDFSNLGGMPFTQNRADFMQQSYREALTALGNLCGNKTILYGVEVTGSSVSDGWIAVNGELIKFVGGTLGATVIISETSVPFTFADNTVHDVQFTKTATTGVGGSFPFTDLVPLLSLQNIWRPGDVKERYCDAAFIAANYDVNGFGIGAEKGWRILSKAYPDTAGKVMINIDFNDPDFNAVGKIGGEKKHTLTANEFSHSVSIPRGDAYTGDQFENDMRVGGGQGGNPQSSVVVKIGNANGVVDGHNNLQPYYVILKLIKL